MTDEDLQGFDPKELECNQCGGTFCGMRVGRIYKGKPLIMCSRRDNVKQVLGQEGERERWHRV